MGRGFIDFMNEEVCHAEVCVVHVATHVEKIFFLSIYYNNKKDPKTKDEIDYTVNVIFIKR